MKCSWQLILFISSPAFAQTVSRTVIDKASNLPIPYVTVKVLHKPSGTMTTANGEFELAFEPTDTILITSIGYQEKILIGRDIGSKVYLSPLPKSLDTVVVRRTRPLRTIILGNGKDFVQKKLKCDEDCWPWGPADLKEEFAEKIIVDSTKAYRLLKLYIPTRKKKIYGPLLIRVYAENNISGFPGEELLFKFIKVERSMIEKNKVVINLAPDDVYISHSNSFFISAGWPPGQRGRGVDFTSLALYTWNKDNTYQRNLASPIYRWSPSYFMKDKNGNRVQINSAYAVEMEERVY